MAEYVIQGETLTEIADAIREKKGGNPGLIPTTSMADEIRSIETDYLNFDMIAYDTLDALMAAAPADNTIGIVTTEPITGWIFSATEPENMTEGKIWIATTDSSNAQFNAFKENGVVVYPKFARQCVDGAWSRVGARSYQNGAWIEWVEKLYIFKSGIGNLRNVTPYRLGTTEISFGLNSIEISPSSDYTSANVLMVLRTDEAIDLSKYSKLCMDCFPTHEGDFNSYLGVSSTLVNGVYDSARLAASTEIEASSSPQIITVDLSTISSSLYVMFHFSGIMSVYNIWLE